VLAGCLPRTTCVACARVGVSGGTHFLPLEFKRSLWLIQLPQLHTDPHPQTSHPAHPVPTKPPTHRHVNGACRDAMGLLCSVFNHAPTQSRCDRRGHEQSWPHVIHFAQQGPHTPPSCPTPSRPISLIQLTCVRARVTHMPTARVTCYSQGCISVYSIARHFDPRFLCWLGTRPTRATSLVPTRVPRALAALLSRMRPMPTPTHRHPHAHATTQTPTRPCTVRITHERPHPSQHHRVRLVASNVVCALCNVTSSHRVVH
jgi:hypothetical protein